VVRISETNVRGLYSVRVPRTDHRHIAERFRVPRVFTPAMTPPPWIARPESLPLTFLFLNECNVTCESEMRKQLPLFRLHVGWENAACTWSEPEIHCPLVQFTISGQSFS